MQIHPLITTTEALTELCARLAKSEFVCVDTEFMRENTYWPELCLVQIADEHEAAATLELLHALGEAQVEAEAMRAGATA